MKRYLNKLRDVRLIGFLAGGLVAGYAVALSMEDASPWLRIVTSLMCPVIVIAVTPFALRPWQETQRKKRISAVVMVLEALVIGVVITIWKANH